MEGRAGIEREEHVPVPKVMNGAASLLRALRVVLTPDRSEDDDSGPDCPATDELGRGGEKDSVRFVGNGFNISIARFPPPAGD